ncbi:MAG: CBS domain-containing protein [Pyrinomonadaceae bacterium]|nr:CBS domain-containing protein [Pyrinomonadaceae bacterium]
MFIKEIMNNNSVFCTEETSLTKVYELMSQNDCDYVTVVESRAHGIPIGVVTEHDICYQILGRGRNPRDMSAANAMNTNIVKMPESSDLDDCLNLMKIKKASRVFIVDENGRLCGTLSRDELEKTKTEPTSDEFFTTAQSFAYPTPGVNRIF